MSIRYWMISNRNLKGAGKSRTLGQDRDQLRYFTAEADLDNRLGSWKSRSLEDFQKLLSTAAHKFPHKPEENHEEQKHVTVFVHGYNSTWAEAAGRYKKLVDDLYTGPRSLGVCVLFTWPSDGHVAKYLPDRKDARESANDLAEVLSHLYDWLVDKQVAAALNVADACRAKTSVIAHSMGNFLVQHAMQNVWTRKNRPLLVSLINQLLMVAADVDNDLFNSGEAISFRGGEGIANLTYRVTALYSGRDSVLGMSAGLKHFGKRRLGRSGLDPNGVLPDNVWHFDCSRYFPVSERNIHSAYFEYRSTIELMRSILRGEDRRIVKSLALATRSAA